LLLPGAGEWNTGRVAPQITYNIETMSCVKNTTEKREMQCRERFCASRTGLSSHAQD
jgi:hypothetical protein